jgi:hypothetical protein
LQFRNIFHLQFRNIFLANLRKRAQFSKHSVSFIRLSGPYVIVTQSFGECIVSTSARPSPFSSVQIAHMLHIAYTSRATLATQCRKSSPICSLWCCSVTHGLILYFSLQIQLMWFMFSILGSLDLKNCGGLPYNQISYLIRDSLHEEFGSKTLCR